MSHASFEVPSSSFSAELKRSCPTLYNPVSITVRCLSLVPHQEYIARVQAVAAQGPGHVFVRDGALSVFTFVGRYSRHRHTLGDLDHLQGTSL